MYARISSWPAAADTNCIVLDNANTGSWSMCTELHRSVIHVKQRIYMWPRIPSDTQIGHCCLAGWRLYMHLAARSLGVISFNEWRADLSVPVLFCQSSQP